MYSSLLMTIYSKFLFDIKNKWVHSKRNPLTFQKNRYIIYDKNHRDIKKSKRQTLIASFPSNFPNVASDRYSICWLRRE